MRKNRVATSGFVALGCVGFIASAPAMADDLDEQQQDRIVVTGEVAKKTSSAKDTAPVVNTPRIQNVISQETIENTASFSLEDALRTVPGITLGAGEGGVASADIPLIRGVDATGDVFVDGVRDVGSQTRESFALESIEVSKGPSTAFGGRGAAAGAINLVSKVARAGNFGSAQMTLGTANTLRFTGDVNQELTDGVAVRLAALYYDADTPGRDSVHDNRWGVAPSITFGAGKRFSATFDYYHLSTDGMPDYGVPLTSRNQLPGGVRVPVDVDYDNFYGLLNRDFQKTEVDAVTAQLRGELTDGVVLSNTTRYSWVSNRYIVTNPDDSAGNVVNGLVWRAIKSRGSESDGIVSNTNLSAAFATGGIGHSVAAGFEYNDTDSTNAGYTVATGNRACPAADVALYNCTSLANPNPNDPWAGSVTRSTTPSTASGREYSFYLFDTVALTPNLLLNGGLRWTDFKAGSVSAAGVEISNSSSFWSYQGGVIFKPTSTTSLYVSYANSKTPPGTTIGEGAENLSNSNLLYEPQETENWEAGAKAELAGGALLLSGAVFQVDRNNIQQRDPTGEVTEILASARLRGAEVSASGTVGSVRMLVGYTYIDSELRDGSANDGNILPQTPKHNVAATVDWQITPRISIGGGAYGASKRYADAANLVSADGYMRFDARAQYNMGDNYGVRLTVNNLTDKRYVVKLRNPHFAVPADGRQALVSFFASY
ncbi:MAG TPA: TonB-dependent siderophore receptor [Croceibacterium sp.]|nr:TonB-dependent siderophore receptor [Croceibacterium sp.]